MAPTTPAVAPTRPHTGGDSADLILSLASSEPPNPQWSAYPLKKQTTLASA